jgi:hypothetical protein
MGPNTVQIVGLDRKTTIYYPTRLILINSWWLIRTLMTGPVKFDNGGYHQITLGIDLFCKPAI